MIFNTMQWVNATGITKMNLNFDIFGYFYFFYLLIEFDLWNQSIAYYIVLIL